MLMLVNLLAPESGDKHSSDLTNMLVRVEKELRTPLKNGLTPTLLAILLAKKVTNSLANRNMCLANNSFAVSWCVSNVYTSLQQDSEWGMHGVQGSFP